MVNRPARRVIARSAFRMSWFLEDSRPDAFEPSKRVDVELCFYYVVAKHVGVLFGARWGLSLG